MSLTCGIDTGVGVIKQNDAGEDERFQQQHIASLLCKIRSFN